MTSLYDTKWLFVRVAQPQRALGDKDLRGTATYNFLYPYPSKTEHNNGHIALFIFLHLIIALLFISERSKGHLTSIFPYPWENGNSRSKYMVYKYFKGKTSFLKIFFIYQGGRLYNEINKMYHIYRKTFFCLPSHNIMTLKKRRVAKDQIF